MPENDKGLVRLHLDLETPGKLRDISGNVVAEVVSLHLDIRGASGAGFELPKETPSVEISGVDVGSSNAVVASASTEVQPALFPTKSGKEAGLRYDPVADVWSHYVAIMKPRHGGMDPQQRAAIRDALKVGTVSELKGAIEGCAASDFHMGANDRKKKYNSITQILKAKRGGRSVREQIDFFLELREKSGVQSQRVPSSDRARLSSAKRDVLDGVDFPADQHVQEKAREAEAWLRLQGIQFDRDSRSFLASPEAE